MAGPYGVYTGPTGPFGLTLNPEMAAAKKKEEERFIQPPQDPQKTQLQQLYDMLMQQIQTPYQYQAPEQLQRAYGQIESMLPIQPAVDPYLSGAGGYFERVMAPGYEAYTPEQRQEMFESQKRALVEDVFKPQEERISARLATSGLAGSGVGADVWGTAAGQQQRALADMYSQIEAESRQATRQDISQAFGMAPTLSQIQMQREREPRETWMQWANMLGGEAGRQAQYGLAGRQLQQAGLGTLGQLLSAEEERRLMQQQQAAERKAKTGLGIGKILGGVLGFALGGPVGAAAGSSLFS